MDGSKNIRIEFLEPHQMRYRTVGDYFETDTEIVFQIVKQNDPRKNLLIALHEYIEYTLCTDRDITEQEIMEFDLQWEKNHPTGLDDGIEPGDDPKAPYRNEHRIAENFERQLAEYLGIIWKEYEDNLIY